MAMLSEAMDMPHHDCARGSTVEKPFLVDLARALGLGPPYRSKREVFEAVWARSTGRLFVGKLNGDTVTNPQLQAILDGIFANNLSRLDAREPAARVRFALARTEVDGDDDPFDALDISDERKSALRAIRVRSGQGKFRQRVLRAYGNRCAITGCSVTESLEAAHITPYRGQKSNSVQNGICLRADLHRLWDTGRLAVDECDYRVLMSSEMVGTDYSFYVGTEIALPHEAKCHPSSLALQRQREWAGL